MRIAIIADALDRQYAGIKSYVEGWVRALDRFDPDNEYFLIRPAPSGDFQQVREVKLPWKNLPGYRAYRYFVEIPALVRRLKADIVVETAHFGPFRLPKNIRRVTFIHDLSPLLFPAWHPFLSRKVQQWLLPGILRRADHLLTNSRFTASEIERVFPGTASKTTVLYPGQNERFKPVADTELLSHYGIEKPYFLYLGTLEPRKNLGLLLRSFERLKRETDCPHQLVIAGKTGWKVEKLLQDLETSRYATSIVRPGYVAAEHLAALYSGCTAFVYPSFYEGFGLPVLEAMSCGATAVVAHNSSLAEVVGDAGMLFDPHRETELYGHMRALIDSDGLPDAADRDHRVLARAQVFRWEDTVERCRELWTEMMRRQ